MDKQEVTRVGSNSFLDYLKELFNTTIDGSGWGWIIASLLIALIGGWLVKYVAKNIMKGAIFVVVLAAFMFFVTAPITFSFFSSVPPMPFWIGFSLGVAFSGAANKDCMMFCAGVIGFSVSMITQGGF